MVACFTMLLGNFVSLSVPLKPTWPLAKAPCLPLSKVLLAACQVLLFAPPASFSISGRSVDTFLPCCCLIRWTLPLVCLQQFSTFGRSVDTCFAMLLGDISVQTTPSAPGAETLNGLKGLVGVASTLFFWTYELLVFMVLLNFLLAIIVDAFSEVKENTHETTGG